MPVILQPNRLRTGTPPRRLRPGLRHPLLQDLVFWYLASPNTTDSSPWLDLRSQRPATIGNLSAASLTNGFGGTTRRGGVGELRFDGSATTATIADADDLSFTSGGVDQPFSLCGWFWIADITRLEGLICKSDSNEWMFWKVTDVTTSIHLELDGAGQYAISSVNLDTANWQGQWIHIAATYDGSENANGIQIYRNAIPQIMFPNTSGAYTGMANTTNPVTLGTFDGSNGFFQGMMDDIRLYRRKLSVRDVQAIYQHSLLGYPGVFATAAGWRKTSAPVTSQTITIAPVQQVWKASTVQLRSTATGTVPSGQQDIDTFTIGGTGYFYLQTINPDTGDALNADNQPTYRIYDQNTNTPITTGLYNLLDATNAPGTYVAAVPITSENGFIAGHVYGIRSTWNIIGVVEAEQESFGVTTRAISITPARWRWRMQALRPAPIVITPARLRWQAQAPRGIGRTLFITPAKLRWRAQDILGRILPIPPAQWRWRTPAQTVTRTGSLPIPPAQWRWRANPLTIIAPFLPSAALAALADFVITGDWLLQSTKLGLKLSLAYNPDGTWEQRLLDLGTIEMTVEPGGGLATVANLAFTLAEDGRGMSMLQRWQRLATIGGTADITLDFRAADGTTVRVFTGTVDTIALRNGRSTVQCVDTSIQRNLQLPQTLVTSNLYPLAASGVLTQPLPLVYGAGSVLQAAPLLFINTSAFGYVAAAHAMSMTSTVAVFNPEAIRFMPGEVSARLDAANATLFVSTPLTQQLLNRQEGTLVVFRQESVTFPEAAIDGTSLTLARVNTTGVASNLDGEGVLAIAATPTSAQKGNNQVTLTLTGHRRGEESDPTVTGQFIVQTVDMTRGDVLRSAIFTTQQYRHSLNPQTTTQTIPNLALGDQEAVEVVLYARNEGGPGTVSQFYEIQEIGIQTAFQPQGDTFPIFLAGDFNGRRDVTGTVTTAGAGTLYTLPPNIIGSLLLDELGLRLNPTMQAATTTYRQRNWAFAGGVGYGWFVTRAPARQILDDAARQAGAILAPDTQGAWSIRPFEPQATPVQTFDLATILTTDGSEDGTGEDATEVILGNMDKVHCRFEIHYKWNVGAQKFDGLLYAYETGTNAPMRDDLRSMCQLSAIRYGVTEPLVIEAYWISTPEAALNLLSHVVNYFSFQRIFLTFDTTLRAINVRLGDVVTVTHPLLPVDDTGDPFEVHSIRISPLSGRVTLTVSKQATVYLEYFTINDQTSQTWYWWFDEAGQLVRDNVPPHVPPMTNKDVTGQSTVPYWHQTIDESGVTWFLYPDTLGQLLIDTARPAIGFGMNTGTGITAIGLNAITYRLSASGAPTEILVTGL